MKLNQGTNAQTEDQQGSNVDVANVRPTIGNTLVSGSRFSGKNNAMILSILPELKKGRKIGIFGCTDPNDIIERLKAHNIDVKSEPMMVTKPLKPVYNLNALEGEIVSFEGGNKVKTGFLFYCH